MIDIKVSKLSKRFNNIAIIKDFNNDFIAGQHYAIKGGNGVGKSTLIKMLCGYLSPSTGQIIYNKAGSKIDRNNIYKNVSLAAPYSSIILDFTLRENFDFLKKFKETNVAMDYNDLLDLLQWKDTKDKLINQFSSGMQQKVNVCFALITKSELLFLDEPTSYMDQAAKEWYKSTYQKFTSDKTVIVASNDDHDFNSNANYIELGRK